MDVSILRDRIRTTLDTNADARRQAELDLKYVSAWPQQDTKRRGSILIYSFSRPKSSQASSTPSSTSYKQSKTMAFDYRVRSFEPTALVHVLIPTQLSCTSRTECPGPGQQGTSINSISRLPKMKRPTYATAYYLSSPPRLRRSVPSSFPSSKRFCKTTSRRNGRTSWTLRCGF